MSWKKERNLANVKKLNSDLVNNVYKSRLKDVHKNESANRRSNLKRRKRIN